MAFASRNSFVCAGVYDDILLSFSEESIAATNFSTCSLPEIIKFFVILDVAMIIPSLSECKAICKADDKSSSNISCLQIFLKQIHRTLAGHE